MMRMRTLTLLPLLIFATSCTTPIGKSPQAATPAVCPETPPKVQTVVKTVDTYCDSAEPINIQPGDILTDATVKLISKINNRNAIRCDWVKVAK